MIAFFLPFSTGFGAFAGGFALLNVDLAALGGVNIDWNDEALNWRTNNQDLAHFSFPGAAHLSLLACLWRGHLERRIHRKATELAENKPINSNNDFSASFLLARASQTMYYGTLIDSIAEMANLAKFREQRFSATALSDGF